VAAEGMAAALPGPLHAAEVALAMAAAAAAAGHRPEVGTHAHADSTDGDSTGEVQVLYARRR
jgi:hypothetical protein